jgi:glycosyltransferase involved in cell wall biosynthesis
MPPDGATEPRVEVVIPVHNEAHELLHRIGEIQEALDRAGVDCRFLLVENGSTDDTWSLALSLESQGSVRALRSPVADYGAALRLGVREARAPVIALAEIDFCDAEFIKQGVALLDEQVDLVQSSKACKGAVDQRPLLRRAITRGFNLWLRLSLRFEGTDTHGMKVARRELLDALVAECVLDGNLLATEIVVRAQRRGLKVRELPVSICETRESAVGVFDRVPSTLRDMSRLRGALKATGRSQ